MRLKDTLSQSQSIPNLDQSESHLYSNLDDLEKHQIEEEEAKTEQVDNQTFEGFVDGLINSNNPNEDKLRKLSESMKEEQATLELSKEFSNNSQKEDSFLKKSSQIKVQVNNKSTASRNGTQVQKVSSTSSNQGLKQPTKTIGARVKYVSPVKQGSLSSVGGKFKANQISHSQSQAQIQNVSQLIQGGSQGPVKLKQDENQMRPDTHISLVQPGQLLQQQEPDESLISFNMPVQMKHEGSASPQSQSSPPRSELLQSLKQVLSKLDKFMPKSFEMLVGNDLESDLLKATRVGQVDDALIKKVQNFIADALAKVEQSSKKKHNFNLSLKDKISQNIKDNARNKYLALKTEGSSGEISSIIISPKEAMKSPTGIKKFRCASPDSKILTTKKAPGKIAPFSQSQMSDEDQSQYNGIIQNFEQTLAVINVKELQRFTKQNGKGPELSLAYQILYFCAEIDNSILLSNDKKSLVASNWDELRKALANGGKIVTNLKKLKEYIENDLLPVAHFSNILAYQEILGSNLIEDQPNAAFSNFICQAIQLQKFVKQRKGIAEETYYKTPARKLLQTVQTRRRFISPDKYTMKKTMEDLTDQSHTSSVHYQTLTSQRSGLHMKESRIKPFAQNNKSSNSSIERTLSKTQSGFKQELSTRFFHKETENLSKQAQKRLEMKQKRDELQSKERNIKKMLFDIEREDKQLAKEKLKKQQLDEIHFQKELFEKNEKILQEQQRKEKEARREQILQEQKIRHDLVEAKKLESQRMLEDLQKDISNEKQYKMNKEKRDRERREIERLQRLELEKAEIDAKETIEKEKFLEDQREIQKKREETRKIEIRAELEALKKKEQQLNEEIELLNRLKPQVKEEAI